MYILKVPILTLGIFSSLTPALVVTSPSRIDGQPLPDRWFSFNLSNGTDLDFPDPSSIFTSAAVRTPVRVCEDKFNAPCYPNKANIRVVASTIAGGIKAKSDQHSCSSTGGNIEGIRWAYYSEGRNCDTTAKEKTIAGAIYHYLKDVGKGNVCGTECLRLDHGGTWRGYVKVGKVSLFKETAYCGPNLSFTNCASGGVNSF